MYVCEVCQVQQPAGTPCKRIVTETKPYNHPFRSGEPPWTPKNAPKKPSPIGEHWEWNDKKGRWVWTWYNDPGGIGSQIVKEVRACPDCALYVK